MDSIVSQDFDLLAPYRQSFAYDDTEKALQSLFLEIFEELFSDQIADIHSYGMPHLGSATVVERFTKQDGLAVLRRPTLSDVIMRVIYANWQSLGSKRGLAFLEFVLRMIWGNEWQIQRLYHSVSRASSYPALITTGETRDSFVTSRIFITLGQNIDVQEALEIAPVVSKLVPANIVAKIASGLDLGEIQPLHLAVAAMPFMIGNFQNFDDVGSLVASWTAWALLKTYSLSGENAIYNGYKTNLQQVYRGTATHSLRAAVLKALELPAYNEMQAIFDATKAIYANAVGAECEPSRAVVLASFLPANRDHVAAAEVMISRHKLGNGNGYTGDTYMLPILTYLGWFLKDGVLVYNVQAPQSERAEYIYTVSNITSLVSYKDAAQLHIADLVKNNAAWTKYTLKSLIQDAADASKFTQVYTALEALAEPHLRAPNDPFTEWQIEQSVTISDRNAIYNGVKTNGTDTYDCPVVVSLSEPASRSLLDTQFQQLPGFINAANIVTGNTEWTIDAANQRISYWYDNDVGEIDDKDWSFDGQTYFATKELARREYQQVNTAICTLNATKMTCTNASNAVVFDTDLTSRPKSIAVAPKLEAFISFAAVLEQIFVSAQADDAAALSYLQTVAMRTFDADPLKRFITTQSLISQFEANKVLRASQLPPREAVTERRYDFVVTRTANPNYKGQNAVTAVVVPASQLTNMFVQVHSEAVANNNANLLNQLENAVISAYKRDKNFSTTNNLYSQYFIEVPFADVVDKIFSNFTSGTAATKASSRELLNQVAGSIFLTAANDRLVKLTDLTSKFEQTKVLESLVE